MEFAFNVRPSVEAISPAQAFEGELHRLVATSNYKLFINFS
jgi:hypothetical protein